MNVGDSVFIMPSGGQNKLTQEEVIARFRAVHGNRYGYGYVNYKNSKTDVDIECPIHGIFQQSPEHHWNGCGCWRCASGRIRESKLIYGVGINDVDEKTRTTSYRVWKGMIGRCYADQCRGKNPTYADCSVCDEWLTYSNFKRWFDESYVEGYDMDKDILIKGNKVYSPETCCFAPHSINSLLINCKRNRGKYPLGVSKSGNKYHAYMRKYMKYIKIGSYPTPEEAFQAYKTAKEAYIKEVATAYYNDGKITQRVYDALMKWTIEITD